MKKLIGFCVYHPISVLMLTLAAVLTGILCVFSLTTDFLPVISGRNMIVSTEYKGISAAEIEEMVTIPVEEAFASLKGLKKTESVSRDGLSVVSIELKWGSDIDMALVQSREIIDACFQSLPSGCGKPEVRETDLQKSTMTIAVIPLDEDLKYARYSCINHIKPFLQRITGVSSVNVSGGEEEQIDVLVGKELSQSKNLTLEEIAGILASYNFEYPAGTLTDGEKELSVKTNGLFTSLKNILETPLQYNNGGVLNLSSIASVQKGTKEKKTFFLLNGKECICISIQKRSDASPLSVSRQIKKQINNLNATLGEYFKFEIIEDRAEYLSSSLKQLCISAFFSFIVTVAVVFFFFKSFILSFLLASVIPLTSIFAIIVLTISGQTINVMSLSGIAIGIGMVIDCSAVAIENIQSKNTSGKRAQAKTVIQAVAEISSSNTGSCLTTIIVFVPFFFIKGLSGELFTSMAIAITSSITASWLLSFTLVPAIYTLLNKNGSACFTEQGFVLKAKKLYEDQLTSLFRKKIKAAVLCVFCLFAGAICVQTQKFSLLPSLASDTVSVDLTFPSGITLENLKDKAVFITNKLFEQKSIKAVAVSGGVEDSDTVLLSSPKINRERIHFDVFFNKPDLNYEDHISNVFASAGFDSFSVSSSDLLSEVIKTSRNQFLFTSENRSSLKASMQNVGKADFKIFPDSFDSEYVFTPDRIALSRFSLTALYSASITRSAIEGVESSIFYQDGKNIPIVVKYKKDDISSLRDVENLIVKIGQTSVPLHVLGGFSQQQNEKILYRYNRRAAKIFVPQDQKLSQLKINGFECENLKKQEIKELWGDSTFLLIVVFVLLYLVLGSQFESFLIPVLLLAALPAALSGAFIFLTIFQKNPDINTVIAMVVLFGSVVNNSIILYEKCSQEKVSTEQDIIKCCVSKLKALLLTNLTTIISLIPFAVDLKNTSTQSTVALTIIGGMIFSLALSLFIFPLLLLPVLKRKNLSKREDLK
ncbi:efflux RND transporter permease subunit [Treponema parvum]|uniref:efflux RND transporter permease subunit n=1 Tax=Treponema parvum TaxID=138851 RepID=UPI001AEBF29E|nr:efflux RND transporter permease subunit [Treponema parvum]QTQ17207.1 efflux RND transporter permease subunit [Treponema parvum]